MYSEELQTIFNRRFHGAVNIKGIDFQILYALYCSLDLLSQNSEIEKVTLEGIEDFDLKPFKSDNNYIQVKTSKNSWNLNDLAAPIKNFIDLNNFTSQSEKFKLILNFEPRDSIKKVFCLDELSEKERQTLKKSFLKLKEFNGIPEEQILKVLNETEIDFISNEDVEIGIKQKLVTFLEISPEGLNVFFLSFAYTFIQWSIERKTITKQDLQTLYIRLQENIQRKAEFEAYSKSWINKIDWKVDEQPTDYFEGKKTRFGHIALDLDVKRPKWSEKIREVFEKINVCIIKEASGQGKSTLALRYIYDNWLSEYTYVVKVAATLEQAEQIANYFKSIAELGLPICVLIDDIKFELQYYSQILENCAGHNIPFLITTRNDDFFKNTKSSLFSADFIIPFFDLSEAKQIFQNLKSNNKIHQNVKSAESAFELIASPKSLIEYIFLITQGKMLHERLYDQIHILQKESQNDKVDFLRKVLIADVCRTPLNLNYIIQNNRDSNLNYQQFIQELDNEFITFEDGYLRGYHWVRSKNLLNILHEKYINPSVTALNTIDLIEKEQIETFVGNLVEIEGLDINIFIEEISKKEIVKAISTFLPIIRGIFRIGEICFYLDNILIFDEAHKEYGEAGLLIIIPSILPTKQINLFIGKEDNPAFFHLKQLSDSFNYFNRGRKLAKKFVENSFLDFPIDELQSNIDIVGEYLEWLSWLEIDTSQTIQKIEALLKVQNVFNLKIKEFSEFSLGFHKINNGKHKKWFIENHLKITQKLETDLNCKLSTKNNEVFIKYPNPEKDESNVDAIMGRLNVIRSAIPFSECYNAEPTDSLYMDEFSSKEEICAFGDSKKSISYESIHPQLEIKKNKVTDDLIKGKYRVKTWYDFLESYYNLRTDILIYTEKLASNLVGIVVEYDEVNSIYIHDKILHSFKTLPFDLNDKEFEYLFEKCTHAFNSISGFLLMKSNFVQNDNIEESKKLMFVHYNDFLQKLNEMQSFFEATLKYSPSYFDFESLNMKEIKRYFELKKLLKINIPQSKQYWEMDSESLELELFN